MYPHLKELLSAFNAHNVKYLIVGAYAVSIHAQPRATKDIEPVAVVILSDIGGVKFDAAWERRAEDAIDNHTCLKAYFIPATSGKAA